MDSDRISQLSVRLQQESVDYKPGDERQRQKLLAISTEIARAIETPSERLARMCYVEIYLFVTARILIDLDIFRILSDAGSSMTATQLADETNSDVVLLGRLLKHVCTQDFVREVGPDEYSASGLTDKIATPEGSGLILDMFHMYRVGDRLPEYLKSKNYQNPTNKDDSAWKFGADTDDHYFEYISRPGRELEAEAFHNHMRFKTLGLKWHEMPNIMNSVFGEYQASKDDVLLVDVGGSSGHDLVSFRSHHPDMTGRLILQDLPEAIEAARAVGELEKMGIEAFEHDFFTPEDICDARVYYLKMVIHDWPDEQCRQILANLKPALKQGHSRILLNEIIIPETDATWFETSVDMIMMVCHSAQERRERHWNELIDSVGGLKVSNIWNVDGAVEKIIEIKLA